MLFSLMNERFTLNHLEKEIYNKVVIILKKEAILSKR